MNSKVNSVIDEIKKVIIGKDEVIEKILMAILANGHILIDDKPGVGKTTMAVAFGKALGLNYKRIQFTPDVLPSDIVGFSMYNKSSNEFVYMPGVVTGTNILLVDEINRSSSKTQSALLEAMEEYQVTVDGTTHSLENPFIVIATENQIGTAGTQTLPQAQLDRFLIRLSIGYPDKQSQMDIIRDRVRTNPVEAVAAVFAKADISALQDEAMRVTLKDEIIEYITDITIATREDDNFDLGVSPRGALAIGRLARACAYVRGRDYVIPQDVDDILVDSCAHRVLLSAKGRSNWQDSSEALANLIDKAAKPYNV